LTDLPRFSSSEEIAFKTCRLAHHFRYVLGYGPTITNRKLSVGINVHEGLELVYKTEGNIYATGIDALVTERLHVLAEERWAELEAGYADSKEGVPGDIKLDFMKDRDMIVAMVKGYVTWAIEEGIDDGYETFSVEEKQYVQIPGAPCLLPIKLDLVQKNTTSGRLRVIDFKTAASFSTDVTKYQLSEQNGNYALGLMAVHGERPTEMVYRELRKINPSARSKPPYYREVRVRLTPEELKNRAEQYVATAKERFDPNLIPVANPSACCGSWKNDWQAPCILVHQGEIPETALKMSPRYKANEDPYERYNPTEETNA